MALDRDVPWRVEHDSAHSCSPLTVGGDGPVLLLNARTLVRAHLTEGARAFARASSLRAR